MQANRDIKSSNPFPGLRPFAPEESDLFFGREAESEELFRKLLKNRFVTVIGSSGSGKSSLIFCGLLPKIRNFGTQESSPWRIVSFKPGSDPFRNLADAISENLTDTGFRRSDNDSILAGLRNNSDGITTALKNYAGDSDKKVLLILDQFEDLFRFNPAGKPRKYVALNSKFVGEIIKAASQPVDNIYIILSIRSDFIGACANYQGLTQLINSSNYLVPNMGHENFLEAIDGPVKYCGANIDPDLVERLLDDIDNLSVQLPVLQHTMMRTWDHWQKLNEPARPLNITDYESIGCIDGALSEHAEEAFAELNERGRAISELMFKCITDKGSDNRGQRHPASIKTIRSVAACSNEELYTVVETFRAPSRCFITPGQFVPLTDDSIIDLSHESLINLWGRLKDWIEDEAASVQMYMRLSEASAMYQQGKTSLWKQPDLQLAINWRDKHKPALAWAERYDPAFERAMVFLRTSEKEYLEEEEKKARLHKRQVKRTRVISMILGISAIISIGFMLFAFVQKIAADREAILAQDLRIQAEKGKIIADSTAGIAIEQWAKADSYASYASQKAEEERRQKELALSQRSTAEQIAARAILQKNEAVKQSDSVKLAIVKAGEDTRVAIEQKNAIFRQRLVSVGKTMSLKSLQLQGQQDLQPLLAYQAYLFNRNNNGTENDADIYAGLYNVALQYGNKNYKSFKGHNGAIKSIAFAPGKKEFYTAGNDGQVLKWSIDGNAQALQILYSGTDIIEVLAVSPDASWLACGSGNSIIRMISLNGTGSTYEMKGHNGKIKSLIFSFNGKYLYSAALDGKVLKWDIAARTSTDVTTGLMQITSIDISSNGNYIAGLNSDGNVFVWDPEKNSDNFRIETTGKHINAIRFNPDNNLLALGDISGNVELWDISLRKKISEVKAHTAQINDIQFNTTLKQMATAGNDKTLKIFNIKDPADLTQPPVTFTDNEGLVLVMQFSPNGELLISGLFEGRQNLISRPAHVDYLVNDICNLVTRDLTQDEWNIYAAKDIPLEKTCPDKNFRIKVDPIK